MAGDNGSSLNGRSPATDSPGDSTGCVITGVYDGQENVIGADEAAMLDAENMAIVLDNLLSNAIDFSPEQGEIRLVVRHADGLWRFDCIDQGPGIADEDRQRIFDPFVQGQRMAPAPRQGSGVGLSIVRELVRAMGGAVYLVPQSTGAHFCVEIPDEQ